MKVVLSIIVCCLVLATNAYSAEESEGSLAKQAQNPIANLVSVPFQSNTNFGIGPYDRTQEVFNIQPVIPVGLGEDWTLITRWILPLVSQPDIAADSGSTFGLGDLNPTFFFSPRGGDFIWGIGPSLVFPTATADETGARKWAAGPSIVGVYTKGPWLVGGLVNNLWSFAGSGDQDINQFLFQPFINYNLPDGWYITSSPVITANWNAEKDHWSVPLGAGVGKILMFAGWPPLNVSIQGFGYVAGPENGPDAGLRLQLQLLFPKA